MGCWRQWGREDRCEGGGTHEDRLKPVLVPTASNLDDVDVLPEKLMALVTELSPHQDWRNNGEEPQPRPSHSC